MNRSYPYSLQSVDPGATKPHAYANWIKGVLSGYGLANKPPGIGNADTLVMETQVIYPRNGAKGAADIIRLAQAAGIYVGYANAYDVVWVKPSEWKKQMKFAAVKEQVLHYLSEGEVALLDGLTAYTKQEVNDIYHAIGIGLHYLRRWRW